MQLRKIVLILVASGFGTVLIGIIFFMLGSGSWVGTIGRIVIVSGVFILVASLVVTRRLKNKIKRKLRGKSQN